MSATPGPQRGRRQVRFGFLGAGWVATRATAPAVHAADGAVLQAVAARDPARAQRLEPAGWVTASYRALVEAPDVDVVYVNLTNEAHLRWTVAALRAGKHVLCEKPLGVDAGEVAAMTAAARGADRLLVEALWYRWHPRMRRLEGLAADGDLGPLRDVEAEFSFQGDFTGANATNYRLDPARGGGALADVGCYVVSAVHAVARAEPVTVGAGARRSPSSGPIEGVLGLPVSAARSVVGPTGVDLVSEATLELADGGAARVRCGIAAPDRQRLVVTGADAAVGLDGEAFTAWRTPTGLTITPRTGGAHVETFEPVDAYRVMIEAMASAARAEPAWLPGLEHSVAVTATLDAIRAQARQSDAPSQ